MKQPSTLLKAAVLASSLLLVGALVLYRAGALDSVLSTDAGGYELETYARTGPMDPIIPDTPGVEQEAPSPKQGDSARNGITISDSMRREMIMMSGSKSGAVLPPGTFNGDREAQDTTGRQPRGDTSGEPVFMGGSKSLAPMIRTRPTDTPSTRRRDTSREPVIIRGSKSSVPMIRVRPSDTPATERRDTAKGRVFMGGSKSLAPMIRPRATDTHGVQKRDTPTPTKRTP